MRSSTLTYSGQALQWTDVSDIQTSLLQKHDLCFQKLTIEVFSSSKMSGESLIASGVISLRKHASQPNQVISSKLRLHESRGRPCGSIEFSGKVVPVIEEIVQTLPSSTSQQLGALLISSLSIKDFTGSSFLGMKSQFCFQLELGKIWKETTAFPSNPKNGSVTMNLQSKVLSASHLSGMELLIHVMGKTMTGGEKIVGTTKFQLQRFLAEPKKHLEITGDIQQGDSFLGKLSIKMCFLPTSSLDSSPVADMAAPTPTVNETSNHNKVTPLPDMKELELSIREQLRKEMKAERDMMMNEIKCQSSELQKSVRSLADIFTKQQQQQQQQVQQPTFVPSEDLALPNDICNWRSVHAMAWLAYQLELPMYMDAFQVFHCFI